MFHVAFLLLVINQVPPPPTPDHGPGQRYAAGQAPADAQTQRKWLLDHLAADLKAQGRLTEEKYREVERMVSNVSDSQVAKLVEHYHNEELAAAQANLDRLKDYRDKLKQKVEQRQQTYQQEQAIAAYVSALAAQQAQWTLGNVYGAGAWPYYSQPWAYYLPPSQYYAPPWAFYVQPWGYYRPWHYGPR